MAMFHRGNSGSAPSLVRLLLFCMLAAAACTAERAAAWSVGSRKLPEGSEGGAEGSEGGAWKLPEGSEGSADGSVGGAWKLPEGSEGGAEGSVGGAWKLPEGSEGGADGSVGGAWKLPEGSAGAAGIAAEASACARPGEASTRAARKLPEASAGCRDGDRRRMFWRASLADGVALSSWRTYAGGACAALAATLSSAGGVGGGGLYVPIFNLLLGFGSKTAAALSSCMILGGIVVNIVWYSFQKKPGPGPPKPLIDYRIALLFLPNVLLGISAGVICNVMSPGWLVTAVLIVVLFVMTFRSCRSAAIRWQKESEGLEALRKLPPPPPPAAIDPSSDRDRAPYAHRNGGGGGGGDGDGGGDDDRRQNGHAADHAPDASQPQQDRHDADADADDHLHHRRHRHDGDGHAHDLEQPLLAPPPPPPEKKKKKKRHPQFPPVELSLLLLVWIVFLAIQLLRGSSDGENLFGIVQCGVTYWVITSSQILIAAAVTSITIWYLRKSSTESNGDEDDDDEEDADDLRQYVVDVKSMVVTSGFALGAGFLGGMLGLGGGTIISPLFIEMGMHPQVTAATCSYVVFFSASLSVVQYWLLGRIPELYALAFAGLSLVFSIIGLLLVQTFISRYGRVSLIVFSVSTVMGISAVLMAGFGTWDAWLQLQEGDYMGFELPC